MSESDQDPFMDSFRPGLQVPLRRFAHMINLKKHALLIALAIGLGLGVLPAPAADSCIPFGGTIYGWHDTPTNSWYGVGNFTVGKLVLYATVTDPNTGFSDYGGIWLGTETAKFDFGGGHTIDLMTDFICEVNPETINLATGVGHVNESGYFANGNGAFRKAWGRFNLQGPFGPGVKLPSEIIPTENDGWFWIGQYFGTICDVYVSELVKTTR
jgi:hypothetical protein